MLGQGIGHRMRKTILIQCNFAGICFSYSILAGYLKMSLAPSINVFLNVQQDWSCWDKMCGVNLRIIPVFAYLSSCLC